jgi:hypothetical protein
MNNNLLRAELLTIFEHCRGPDFAHPWPKETEIFDILTWDFMT